MSKKHEQILEFNKRHPRNISFIIGFFNFLSTVVTTMVSAILTTVIITYVPVIRSHIPEVSVLAFILMLSLVSFIIGSISSYIIMKFPLRPISKTVHALDLLAEGEYSVRLDESKSLTPMDSILSDSINRLAEELQNTEILRSDFINDFSHEFKTPIVSIRGFAKILRDGNVTEDERKEYLDIIMEESSRLSNLSANVLNLNKLENQTIQTDNEDFNFAELVRRIILILEPKWSKKEISMNIDLEEINYYGDTNLLAELVLNIIDNAIKFSPVKGDIDILLKKPAGYNMDERYSLVFTVKDNGIGMTKEEQERVFDKFYQADKSHSTEGNGLGLSVVKRISAIYHGNIAIKSAPDEGCLFEVTL